MALAAGNVTFSCSPIAYTAAKEHLVIPDLAGSSINRVLNFVIYFNNVTGEDMTTYADYQAQIAALQEQAEAVRRGEVATAKAKIKEIMDTYGLTINDLSGAGKVKSGAPRTAVPAKYRDPATG